MGSSGWSGGNKYGKNPSKISLGKNKLKKRLGRRVGGKGRVYKILAPEDPDYPHRSKDSVPLDLMGEEVFEAEMELDFQGERR